MNNRIAFIIDSRGVGGVEKRFSVLFKYLIKNKIKIDITFIININLFNKIKNYRLKSNTFIKVKLFGSKLDLKNKYINRLFDISSFIINSKKRYEQYDVIIFVTTRSLIYRKILKSRKKILVVYAQKPEKLFRTLLFKRISKESFLYDCLSEDIGNKLKEVFPSLVNKINVSPGSFIDYSGTEYNWDEKENVITFCGRFDKVKGIDLLLEFVELWFRRKNHHLQYKFQIIGYGILEHTIQEFIKRHQLEDKIELFYSPDPKVQLRKSKIFLSLQKYENYPSQSLLEAMACGNAIIATDVGLTRKIISNKVGRLVKYDATQLVSELNDIYNKDSLLRHMAQNARSTALSYHTADKYFDYLLKLFYKNDK